MKGTKSAVSSIIAVGLLAGPAAGVGAQDTAPPSEFSGRLVYSHTIEGRADGGAWAYVAQDVSDPRFDGYISITGNSSELANGAEVWSSAFRIENDDGAWQEVPGMAVNFGDADASTRTGLLWGEGSYEGLVAVADLAWDVSGSSSAFDVRGIVLDVDDLPPTVADIAGIE